MAHDIVVSCDIESPPPTKKKRKHDLLLLEGHPIVLKLTSGEAWGTLQCQGPQITTKTITLDLLLLSQPYLPPPPVPN